jgi:hypothetical protein
VIANALQAIWQKTLQTAKGGRYLVGDVEWQLAKPFQVSSVFLIASDTVKLRPPSSFLNQFETYQNILPSSINHDDIHPSSLPYAHLGATGYSLGMSHSFRGPFNQIGSFINAGGPLYQGNRRSSFENLIEMNADQSNY